MTKKCPICHRPLAQRSELNTKRKNEWLHISCLVDEAAGLRRKRT